MALLCTKQHFHNRSGTQYQLNHGFQKTLNNPFTPKFKKYTLPTFQSEMYKWGTVAQTGSIIIFHLSMLWKAKFFILCDVIFLVRLQGKFELDHSWEWKGWSECRLCTYHTKSLSPRRRFSTISWVSYSTKPQNRSRPPYSCSWGANHIRTLISTQVHPTDTQAWLTNKQGSNKQGSNKQGSTNSCPNTPSTNLFEKAANYCTTVSKGHTPSEVHIFACVPCTYDRVLYSNWEMLLGR